MGLEIAEIYQQKIFFVENIILSVEMKHSPIRFILFRAERQKSSFAIYMIKGKGCEMYVSNWLGYNRCRHWHSVGIQITRLLVKNDRKKSGQGV